MAGGDTPPIKASIWLTAHTRMAAEKRYRVYDVTSNLLLSWLSLSVTVWAVVRSLLPANPSLDVYVAVVSTFVFAFSIITFGFKFGETAAAFRECYLRLQKLCESEVSETELTAEYHSILGGYSNHGEKDYEAMVLNRTLFDRKKLWDRHHNAISWTGWMLTRWAARRIGFWALAIAIAALGLFPYRAALHVL